MSDEVIVGLGLFNDHHEEGGDFSKEIWCTGKKEGVWERINTVCTVLGLVIKSYRLC